MGLVSRICGSVFLRKIKTRQFPTVTIRLVDGLSGILALFTLGFQRSTPFRGDLGFEKKIRGCDRNLGIPSVPRKNGIEISDSLPRRLGNVNKLVPFDEWF